ncbi:MAG: hypothetical protein NVS9B15_15580 [Acidobacteriaceae bacterium]
MSLPRPSKLRVPSLVSYAWNQPHAVRSYRSAVSLHSHTNESKENLAFLNDLVRTLPLLASFIAWQQRRAERAGFFVDWNRAYWTPPLTPAVALALERRQIEQDLQLNALVSLTDHDTIAAPLALNSIHADSVPVACEWTIPFGEVAFHIGVHNLPAASAAHWMAQLAVYTASPSPAMLKDLLSTLHGIPDVLVVFNHPMWNLYRASPARFSALLDDFLSLHSSFLHAIELNGLRTWRENCASARLAAKWRKPLIAGGDRHGCEPNANLNLTNAEDFGEFVSEVRTRGTTHVLFMPQYRHSRTLRYFRSFVDVVREAPELPSEIRRWDQRVFHPGDDGRDLPISAFWKRPPAFLQKTFAAACRMEACAASRKLLSHSSRWTQFDPDSLAEDAAA